MVQCVLVAMFLGNVNVTKERNAEKDVVYGVYLLHILRRRKGSLLDAEQIPEGKLGGSGTA